MRHLILSLFKIIYKQTAHRLGTKSGHQGSPGTAKRGTAATSQTKPKQQPGGATHTWVFLFKSTNIIQVPMGRSTVQLRRIVPITAAAQLRHHRDLWTFDGSNANLKRTPAQDEYQRWGHQVTTHCRYGKDFGMGSTQPIRGATKQGTILHEVAHIHPTLVFLHKPEEVFILFY